MLVSLADIESMVAVESRAADLQGARRQEPDEGGPVIGGSAGRQY
jgi:hypothetical protein